MQGGINLQPTMWSFFALNLHDHCDLASAFQIQNNFTQLNFLLFILLTNAAGVFAGRLR